MRGASRGLLKDATDYRACGLLRVYYRLMQLEEPDATDFQVHCPYCGEDLELTLESDVQGTLVMDCEVCCRPWQVEVTRDSEYRYVNVTRGDGSD